MTDTTETLTLPGSPAIPGLRARHYRGPEDLPAIAAVLHASRRADGVDWLPSFEEVQHEFEHLVNEEPERDMILAEVDGEVVAYVRASWALRDECHVYHTTGDVLPGFRRRGLGRALQRAAEARLREISADHPADGPRRFGSETIDGQIGAKALLSAEGYTPIRWFAEMRRPLADPIPDIATPSGLVARPVAEADHHRIFDAEEEAFRDHWGSRAWTEADFQRTFTGPDVDTSLWRVMWDGDEVAGVTESFIYATENAALGVQHGWLERISTRRPWRGRGVARAMIVSAMVALRDRGMTHAALGVDADNPSGAFGVYESLGFRVVTRMEVVGRPFDDAR